MKKQSVIGMRCNWVFLRLLFLLFLTVPILSPAVSRMDVHGGTLEIGSTLLVEEIRVDHGATLGGTGTLIGNLTVAGAVEPAVSAPSPASLLVQGNATFLSGSTFLCRATTHTESDQLNVEGTISGTCTVIPDKEPAAIPVNKVVIASLNGFYNNFSLSTGDELNWRLVGINDSLLLTDLVGDSDSNGLPDWFEIEYFVDRTGAADPDGHDDSDEMTNWEEYIAGTDPLDGNSLFALTAPSHLGGSSWIVNWPSAAGRQYTLYYRTNLLSGPALMAEDVAATPPTNSLPFSSSETRIFIHAEVERISGP